VTIFWANDRQESLPREDKELVAQRIWDRVEEIWTQRM